MKEVHHLPNTGLKSQPCMSLIIFLQFERKIKSPDFLQQVPVGSQNIQAFLNFTTFVYSIWKTYKIDKIWLNLLVADHQFGYIKKLNEKENPNTYLCKRACIMVSFNVHRIPYITQYIRDQDFAARSS
jgi:hypothetical protein